MNKHSGAAIGSPPAPSYANIFVAGTMEEQIPKIPEKYQHQNNYKITLLQRFLYDYIK